jgi:hypothetical protein
MSKRKENHNLEMKKKEDELKQKQKELDCQTNVTQIRRNCSYICSKLI